MTRFERIAYIASIVGLVSALLVLNGQNEELAESSNSPVTTASAEVAP
ncbi:MAG: hypothetical protein KC502_02455 [Myxococcales bacterium]|nr:hypothetical protein [Myxococcales bacterium]